MGRDLRAWRKAPHRRLKAKEVAQMLGYTPQHISRVENGRKKLSRKAWRILMELRQFEERSESE